MGLLKPQQMYNGFEGPILEKDNLTVGNTLKSINFFYWLLYDGRPAYTPQQMYSVVEESIWEGDNPLYYILANIWPVNNTIVVYFAICSTVFWALSWS